MMTLISRIWRVIPYPIRLIFVRSTQAKFTISVVAIVLNPNNEILVLDHYIRPGATWGLPGGFIDADEMPDQAIAREIKEETNLELGNIELLRVRTINKHMELLYKATADGEVELKSNEIRDYGWFNESDLPEGVSEIQRGLISESLS